MTLKFYQFFRLTVILFFMTSGAYGSFRFYGEEGLEKSPDESTAAYHTRWRIHHCLETLCSRSLNPVQAFLIEQKLGRFLDQTDKHKSPSEGAPLLEELAREQKIDWKASPRPRPWLIQALEGNNSTTSRGIWFGDNHQPVAYFKPKEADRDERSHIRNVEREALCYEIAQIMDLSSVVAPNALLTDGNDETRVIGLLEKFIPFTQDKAYLDSLPSFINKKTTGENFSQALRNRPENLQDFLKTLYLRKQWTPKEEPANAYQKHVLEINHIECLRSERANYEHIQKFNTSLPQQTVEKLFLFFYLTYQRDLSRANLLLEEINDFGFLNLRIIDMEYSMSETDNLRPTEDYDHNWHIKPAFLNFSAHMKQPLSKSTLDLLEKWDNLGKAPLKTSLKSLNEADQESFINRHLHLTTLLNDSLVGTKSLLEIYKMLLIPTKHPSQKGWIPGFSDPTVLGLSENQFKKRLEDDHNIAYIRFF